MNIKMIFYTIGNLLKVEATLLCLPLIVSFIYKENTYLSWLIPIAALLLFGILLTLKKPEKRNLYAKEGMALVGLSWIVLSLFGCLPFVISRQIPNFIDALFETVSGFTTTGASILTNIEELSHSMLFWRSFTHWIGGMGVLVFVLAILPNSEGHNIFILRAESTGPQVGKLVSKVKVTARILYLIYLGFTISEMIFLLFGKMPLFDSIVTSFATAGTGGFGIKSDSIASYSTYCQMVIAIFMLLFGINFNIFYFIIIGKVAQALKSEELRTYIIIIAVATITIALNIFFVLDVSLSVAFKDSFFQVVSFMTSTGFVSTNYDIWPELSQIILFFLMFIGACAGSTGGGMKVSRFMILMKSIKREIKKIIHPNSITNIRLEGTTLDESVVKGVCNYFTVLITIFVVGVIVISLNGFDFVTTISSVVTTLNNDGPGFGSVIGATGNFASFSVLSKLTLSLLMLIGRLEIYPILILFSPKVWLNK